MEANLIDLSQAPNPVGGDLVGLTVYLSPLVGEPFRFARVSYGDELTLHFGDIRPARSPKLAHRLLYGAYVLGLRASPWILKSGGDRLVITTGIVPEPTRAAVGSPLSKEELETGRFIEPDGRVVAATPFIVTPAGGLGLQLRISDGSSLLVLPAIQEAEEPEDQGLPKLADWELSSPSGLLSAGSGLTWTFKPTGAK